MAVADVVRTTLGPRGMDKLIHSERVRDWAMVLDLWRVLGPGDCLVDRSVHGRHQCRGAMG